MKTLTIVAISLLIVLPAFIYASSGLVQYGKTGDVTKYYDHDEGVICYTFDRTEITFSGFKFVGGISCVKDN